MKDILVNRKLGQKEMKEGKYSLFTDTWIEEPYTIDLDFNPEEVYEERRKVIEEFIKEFDLKIADISRLVQDVDFLKETLEQVPTYVRTKWKKWLDKKLEELEESIKELYEKVEEVIKARHELKERYGPDVEENLLFKYLQRYQYIWLAKQLKKVMGKGFEETEEVEKVKDVLEEFPFRKKSVVRKFRKVSQYAVGPEEEEFKAMPRGAPPEGLGLEPELKPALKPEPRPIPEEEPDEELRELRRMLEPEEREKIPPRERIFEKEKLFTKPEEELAELVEAPRIFRKLGPIDRQMFLSLERKRQEAIRAGDVNALRWIHDEEERLLEKYVKEVVKVDELSGFTFAVRQIGAHFIARRNKFAFTDKILEKICEELRKMNFIVHHASLLEVETEEWSEEPKGGYTEWHLKVGSLYSDTKANIIVKAEKKGEDVIIYPYFFDLLGRKYSFDEVSLKKFIGELREKPTDIWIEPLGWEEDEDLIKIDNKYVWSSVNKSFLEEKFKERFKEVRSNIGWLYLKRINFEEDGFSCIYGKIKEGSVKSIDVPKLVIIRGDKFRRGGIEEEKMEVKVKYKLTKEVDYEIK